MDLQNLVLYGDHIRVIELNSILRYRTGIPLGLLSL